MPYSLTLLVLPMCLHLASREQILENKRLSVLRVFALRPDLLVDFAERARALVQYATEAFALLASKDCIKVDDDGGDNDLELGACHVLQRVEDGFDRVIHFF